MHRLDEATTFYRTALQAAMEIEALPTALEILGSLAPLLTAKGIHDRTADLLALVSRHPSSMRQTRDRAARMLAQLEGGPKSQAKPTAHRQKPERDLGEIVELILNS